MVKGKHISLEDIATIFKNESNACAGEEEMLALLQHLAVCSECTEKVKAHRRMDMLLENWSPELHGQAYRKSEALKQLEESRRAGRTEDENDEADSEQEYEEYDEYNENASDYDSDSDDEDDCEDGCDCGYNHHHSHEHNPEEN